MKVEKQESGMEQLPVNQAEPRAADITADSISTPTLTHASGMNLKIGNPANPNYVEFVEDTKFGKTSTFAGSCTFSGNSTFSGTSTFSSTVNLPNSVYLNYGSGNSHITTAGAGGTWSKITFYKSPQLSEGIYQGIDIATDTDIVLYAGSHTGNNLAVGLYIGQGKMHCSRSITCAGSLTTNYGSDRRLKTNITQLTGASEVLKKLNVYEFDYTNEAMKRDVALPEHTFGLMYDEVRDTKLEMIASVAGDGFGGINYNSPALSSMILASLKEQIERIDELVIENKELKCKIEKLESIISC